MKTIEEAAKEFSNRCPYGVWRDDAELAFKSGAEFAQRWISVEEEKPKVDGPYLIKSGNGYVCTLSYKNGMWSTMGYQSDIKYWRPIELK